MFLKEEKIQQCVEKIKGLEREIARKDQKQAVFSKEPRSQNEHEKYRFSLF